MKPIYIFGSGTSPAPNVGELTNAVMTARMHRGDGPFYPGDKGDPDSDGDTRRGHSSQWIRHYLGLVREDIARYRGRELDEINYEEVSNICVQLHKEAGSGRNAALRLYVSELRRKMNERFPSFGSKHNDFNTLASAATDWISWAIHYELLNCQRKPEALRSFIKSVLKGTKTGTIATLNHDLHLEKILGKRANTGFRGSSSSPQTFDPNKLAEKEGIKVLKLHGSIDWFWHDETGHYRRLAEFSSHELDDKPALLAGTVSKLEDYNFGILPWLWSEFQNPLRQSRRVIISGYGFKDVGLNTRLAYWLDHFSNARMVIIHHNPSKLIEETKRERIDGVCGFFDRYDNSDEIAEPKASSPANKITFIPIGFEQASEKEWSKWLRKFAGHSRH